MNFEVKSWTDPQNGLNPEQVRQAKKNQIEEETGKSYRTIFQSNLLTLFNAINVFLAFLVLLTGSLRNMLFMGVVFFNALIGIVQEIRSKRKLDALALLNQPRVSIVRQGKEQIYSVDQIVENDILILRTGDQVPVDGVVIDGFAECNESMLTGESDAVLKRGGDTVYSGSYLEAGKVRMQAVLVGDQTYAHSILRHAKREKKYPSMLRDALDTIIRIITFLLIPAGLLLFGKSFFISHASLNASILSMVAGVVGMIPEGLVILTSIALAIGALRLANRKVLVQELYCIETLARVDTLCLDKTGTITEGRMKVSGLEVFNDYTEEQVKEILSKLFSVLDDQNATAMAIREYCPRQEISYQKKIPFSSARKGSGVIFEEDAYVIGAYPFLVSDPDPEILKKIEDYAKQGIRVLTLCLAKEDLKTHFKGNHIPVALVLIQDVLRPNIQAILDYFARQDVTIKIISGDDVHTVQAIAQKAGVQGTGIDMDSIEDVEDVVNSHSVFGRVTPEQKRDMIKALKKQGHVVAMTGDGVNDVMALKEADCSITMGSGSEATKNIASLVLLENQFSAMPSILDQGRCVINNIQRTASLFLVKTLMSLGLALMTLFLLDSYPFIPIQLTLISSLATGLPSFILTLEPNTERVKGNFLRTVLSRALPGALCVLFGILSVYCFDRFGHQNLDHEQFSTMCTILAGCNSLCVLLTVCKPMTRIRFVLVTLMIAAFCVCCIVPFFQDWFCIALDRLRPIQILYVLIHIPLIFWFVWFVTKKVEKLPL